MDRRLAAFLPLSRHTWQRAAPPSGAARRLGNALTPFGRGRQVKFGRKGDGLRAMPFSALKDSDLDSEVLLVPVGDRFLRIAAGHPQRKRNVYLVTSGGLVFVAGTRKGLYISVVEARGNLLRTIDSSADAEPVPDRARLRQFCISGGRIYATTDKKLDGKTETIVLDLESRIVRRLYLPLASIRPQRGSMRYDLFTVSRGKLYELVQHGEK